MTETQLPIDFLYWGLALLPLIVLLVLLLPLQWTAPKAAPVGMVTAAIIALLAFRTPWDTLAIASARGIWDAIFILYVIWPALLLYRITDRAGAFAALRRGIRQYSRNELFLVLAFGWVFASFLQGITGFGAPVAVVAPLLVALGLRPVCAVAVPLIGHAWANMFGTLAVCWLATLQVVDLQNPTATALETALLLWVPNLTAGFTIAWMYGRRAALRQSWPMVLMISLIHGGLQFGLMFWNPILSTLLAVTAALMALYPLSTWDRYSEPVAGIEQSPMMRSDRTPSGEKVEAQSDEPKPVMDLRMALVPYVILAVMAVLVLVVDPVEATLEQVQIGVPLPAATTGYGISNEAQDPYDPISLLTHPGAFLLAASAVTWLVYRWKGYYRRWAQRTEVEGLWSALVGDAVPSSLAVLAFLVMSGILDYSGQTEVLALGISKVAPPLVYAFAANFIGVLGAFMTSSNTASNVLFAPLQLTVANAEGLSEASIIAAQGTGGAVGNAIAPANVVLGTGTAGIVGCEGAVIKRTIYWTLGVSVIVGGFTLLLNALMLFQEVA